MPRRLRVLIAALACSLAGGCGSVAPSASSAGSSAAAVSSVLPSPTATPAATTAPEVTPAPDLRHGEAWIAFQSLADQFDPRADHDGVEHDDTIFLARPDGSGLHRLAPEDFKGSEIRPTWSPDGSRVAFIRARFPDDSSELWAIDADGHNAQLLYRCDGPQAPKPDCNSIDYPDWASDGSIYFGRDTVPAEPGPPTTFELYRYSFETGSAEGVMTRHVRSIEQSRMSPDARQVVYVSYRNLTSDAPDDALFVADLATGDERRITDWGTFAAYPDWSVDDLIAFNTYDLRLFPDVPVPSNLYTVRPDGTDLTQLTDLDDQGIRSTQPRWTHDGRSIVYTLVTPNPRDPYGDRHIWELSPGGASPSMIAGGLVGSHPEFRPVPGM